MGIADTSIIPHYQPVSNPKDGIAAQSNDAWVENTIMKVEEQVTMGSEYRYLSCAALLISVFLMLSGRDYHVLGIWLLSCLH